VDWPEIDPEIGRAHTLPGEAYTSAAWFERARERIFAHSWQLCPDPVPEPQTARPWSLLPGCLDEPLVVTTDPESTTRVLSNVCTHRGNLLVREPCAAASLRCRYHGRRFSLDGRCTHMPEFEGVEGFPAPSDDLHAVRSGTWGGLCFAALEPSTTLAEHLAPVRRRLDFFGLEAARFEPAGRVRYPIAANWALYCDNFLEGFHIPFVHAGLAKVLDWNDYETICEGHSSVQIGIAAEGEPSFDLPAGHPDAGRRVAGYFFWLFPNTMLNFYPWGLSINVVVPTGPTTCAVEYATWIRHEALRGRGAGADLPTVEAEDQEVVTATQLGVRGRYYGRGRYSPRREQGVHHFHRLLVAALR
jgi:choline monooxygenase